MILPYVPHAPHALRFLVLTVSMLGLQLVWSCEMAQASPYLLSLGVSKSHMAIVFLAGE
jgi:solute carrier family 45, member 1/2/4